MAAITIGIGTSHSPMLNATSPADWAFFLPRDQGRKNLDVDGNPASYEELMRRAGPSVALQATPEKFIERHKAVMKNIDRLRAAINDAELDALIVIGDDQNELFDSRNVPCFLVYQGDSIPNVPDPNGQAATGLAELSARYYETDTPRDYPVDAGLARHLIEHLVQAEFDVSTANTVEAGQGEGHAFAFIHNRLMAKLPIVPVFLNAYFPPNLPSPARCYRLGQAIAEAVKSYPEDLRVGVCASGGLSHFTVDEDLDQTVIAALAEKDAATLTALPANKLQAGSSEIRNWICAAGALEGLQLEWSDYQPGYRTPAGTGTGLAFAVWR